MSYKYTDALIYIYLHILYYEIMNNCNSADNDRLTHLQADFQCHRTIEK